MLLSTPIFRLLLGCFLIWGALFYNSIESTVVIWYRSETFAHCFIILPICLYLIKQKWQVLLGARIQPNFWGLIPIAGVMVVWLFGSLAQLLVVEQGAAFMILPLIIWTVLGNQVARILLFTLLFWMFSVPFGEFLIPALQELTADITVWSLQLTGIPVYREGLYIAVPGGLFEVAVACSGIRYLIASLTLGTLFAYLNYNSFKKRLIFVGFSILLPLIANGIRAYGIVMIAHLSDMKYATGVDHLIYGWLFFGVVILIMFAVGSRWADPIPKVETDLQEKATFSLKRTLSGFVVVSAVILMGWFYKQLVENPKSDFRPDLKAFVSIERDIVDQSWLPIFDGASLIQTGHKDGIDYFMAYYDRNEHKQELVSSANKFFNFKRWSIISSKAMGDYRELEITNSQGQRRRLAYTYVTRWTASPNGLKIKLSQAVQSLLGQAPVGMVLVVSAPDNKAGDYPELYEQVVQQSLNHQLTGPLNHNDG